MFNIKKSLFIVLFCSAPLTLLTSAGAYADNVNIEANPSTWKLQNYIGDGVVLWYTGSSCASGQMTFGTGATSDDKNRLWSTVMAAKVSGRKVYVAYDNSTANCYITSFGMHNQ